MNIPDTRITIKWSDPKKLPKTKYTLCAVLYKNSDGNIRETIPEWFVEKINNKTFKYFKFNLYPWSTIYYKTKEFKNIIAWGYLEKED